MRYIILLLTACMIMSCSDYSPQPQGYFRIDTPVPSYQMHWEENGRYGFETSEFAQVTHRSDDWLNIVYPFYKGEINCTYKKIDGNFQEMSEDVRNFVYKPHSSVAEGIAEQFFGNPDHKVYGMLYELKGNTASPIQFMLTDSVSYMFRGALYFAATPNKDSIAPVVDYIGKDIVRIMETFQHKEQ